jgi:REP element-mobilizing transposase RayT
MTETKAPRLEKPGRFFAVRGKGADMAPAGGVMRFNPEIHRRRSIRLQGYDYADGGAYFITVCVQGQECLFGQVSDDRIHLNTPGQAVLAVWTGLLERFPNVVLDEFVVMPNHFHGILFLTNCRGEPCVRPMDQEDQNDQGDHKDRPYGTAPGSVSRIVQAFKSLTTNAYIRGVEQDGWPPFPGRLWQRNYYERIIRNENELARARRYIADNPAQWALDKENPANIP